MVNRPYHDYATSALRELSIDLAASQAQLQDQRADCVGRAGSGADDVRQLDFLINDLGYQLATLDQELVTRRRERTAAAASTDRGVTGRPGRLRSHRTRVIRATPKPHFRAKRAPTAVRTPQ
jgi:hypothetical protein